MIRWIRVFVFLLLATGETVLPHRGEAADPSLDLSHRIVSILVDRGFENVAADTSQDGAVSVWYENRIYRYELTALGTVAFLAAAEVDSSSTLEIVTQTRGRPVFSTAARAADWLRFLRGEVSEEWFQSRLTIRAGGEIEGRGSRGSSFVNSSRWKVDFAARPLVEMQFGIPDDPFQLGFWVAPEATMSPLRGVLVTAQGTVRVTDDFNETSPRVSLGRTTISAAGNLPASWVGALSAGHFPGERYGIAGEAGRFYRDGALEVRVAGDVSGLIRFTEDVVVYSAMKAWTGRVVASYRLRKLDLVATATGGRFLYEDVGGRLDLLRRVHEVDFGFFVIKTDDGTVGGFRLNVPLPVEKLSRPARVRWVTVPAFPWEYRESTEPVGIRVRIFDDLDRFRKGLDPVFVRNNLGDLRSELREAEREAGR